MNDAVRREFELKTITAQEAAKMVRSGDTVYVGANSTVACALTEALGDRAEELEHVTLAGGLITQDMNVFHHPAFRTISYFLGPNARKLVAQGISTYTSQHLHRMDMWSRQTVNPDVAFLEVSEPDADGNMSYGATGVGFHMYIASCARTVILQINRNQPYVYGQDNTINIKDADYVVYADTQLAEVPDTAADETVERISRYIIDLIPDGACIQLGIGGISGAVGYGLKDRNDLGIHTEMMTNSMMYLMKRGVVSNRRKSFHPGKTVAGFAYGSSELYRFVDKNEQLYFAPFPVVNDPRVIAQNDDMVSVNTAMSIDLFGQVCAENIGGRQYSGIGGQVDFIRGAEMSRGGKAIIAIQSTGENRKLGRYSKICFQHPAGAVITTSRADIQYVVTEYGAVNLMPLSMRDRVRAMISLAHPDFRDQLTEEAKQARLL